MFKYLIADYILGYSLSTDYPFSPADMASELHLPPGPVLRIFLQLHRLNRQWFTVTGNRSAARLNITRNKEYDEDIIQWLIQGESKKLFKEARVIKYHNKRLIVVLAATVYFLSKSSTARSLSGLLRVGRRFSGKGR